MNIHELYMQRCIDLAQKGMGCVAPNPLVGAVIVYENRIIGEGWHQQFGGPHAEVNCINNVAGADRHLIAQSTMYVSLEPCNHHGKTPPCTQLIIDSQIKKVVVACQDPFEKVNGAGFQRLSDSGVEVVTGMLQKEAQQLNKRFFTFHNLKRPYVILKWAQSADGFIAATGGKKIKISNAITDTLVHKWRSEESAIMVGTNTAINDNPSLTTRLWPGKNPLRIFIDKQLRVNENSHLLDNSTPTLIFNQLKNEKTKANEYVMIGDEQFILKEILTYLYGKGIQSLIVEGGTQLLQSFIDEALWDEARVITNKALNLKEGILAPQLKDCIFSDCMNSVTDDINIFRNIQTER